MTALKKKNRRILIGLLIFLIAAVILYARWDTWFYNPPEPPYVASKSPDRILLTWSEDPCTTRNVSWQTDTVNQNGWLQLINLNTKDTAIFSSSRTIIQTSGGVAAYFKAEIKNLHPGSAYAYRVGNGNFWSEWNQFRTRCPGDSAFSLLYIGDIQDSINGKTGEVFRKAWEKDPKAEMVIFIGDMIERPHDEYWKEWFKAGGDLFRTLPIIATPGNHEYYKELIQKIDPRWMAHFDFPQNGPKNFKGRVCFWDYGNTRFISMDTNGLYVFTALTQRNWLKKTLENTTSRWKVVMMHHPAYTISRTHDNFLVRWLFKPLFDRYKVDLVLQGHEHGYGRAGSIPNSVYPQQQGPVYMITQDSPKLYDLNFSKEMDQLASNTQMYQIIAISGDSLSLQAYTKDGTLYDDFALLKNARGENKLIDRVPKNIEERLLPTRDFIKNHSRELGKYNQQMISWLKAKGRKLP